MIALATDPRSITLRHRWRPLETYGHDANHLPIQTQREKRTPAEDLGQTWSTPESAWVNGSTVEANE